MGLMVHAYYIKGAQVWEVMPKQASWLLQRILKAHKYVLEARLVVKDFEGMQQYSIKKIYKLLLGDFPKVTWKKLVCNNYGAPKWIFILRLAIMNNLYTEDKLGKWGMPLNEMCVLYQTVQECRNHLFFECTYAHSVWSRLLVWQKLDRSPEKWETQIVWILQIAKENSPKTQILKMSLVACVYHLWQERNRRLFQGASTCPGTLIRKCIKEVVIRASLQRKLEDRVQELDCYPD